MASLWKTIRIVYWVNLGICLIVGLPVTIVGIGFAGGTSMAFSGLMMSLFDDFDVGAWWIVSPLWLLPFYFVALWMKPRRLTESSQ